MPAAILPPHMVDPTVPHVLTVRAHEVEHGDTIVGFATPVASVLFSGADGRWYFADRFGTIICRRHRFATLQVLRGGPLPVEPDATPSHGIDRPEVA